MMVFILAIGVIYMSLEGAPSMKYVMHYTGNTVTVTADIRIYNVVEQVLNGA